LKAFKAGRGVSGPLSRGVSATLPAEAMVTNEDGVPMRNAPQPEKEKSFTPRP